jgi:GNAT superfamily N-acetyltransferase
VEVALLAARLATSSDVAEVTRLWDLAVCALEGQRGGSALAASISQDAPRDDPAALIKASESAIVLGLIDDVPVGISHATLQRIGGNVVAGLDLIFVEPAARRIGVADTMLEVLLERCAAWGTNTVDALALPGDRATKALFEAHGFKARLLVMQRVQAPAGNGA